MANHRTFSEQDILDAATQLENANKPINGNALRRIIGSGRPSSLLEAYKRLIEAGKAQLPQEATQDDSGTIESHNLPTEIQEELELGLSAITAMISRCNDLAHHVVEQRLNKATQEAKDARIAAESAVQEAEVNETKAWDEVDTTSKFLEEALEMNEQHSKRIVELEQQLKAEKAKTKDLQGMIAEKQIELNHSQNAYDDAEKRTSEAEGKLSAVRDQLDAEKATVREIRERNEQQNQTIQENAKTIGGLEGELNAAKGQASLAQEQRDQVVSEKAALEASKTALEATNTNLLAEVEQLKKPRTRKTKNQDSASKEESK